MIKAIETEYAGCRFRSRLEARWAVFFDALGVRWEYELEGFETSKGRYLPDFKIVRPVSIDGDAFQAWFEVKPPTFERDTRHEAFADESLDALIVASGLPRDYSSQYEGAPLIVHTPGLAIRPISLYQTAYGGLAAYHVRGPDGCSRVDHALKLARSERFGT